GRRRAGADRIGLAGEKDSGSAAGGEAGPNRDREASPCSARCCGPVQARPAATIRRGKTAAAGYRRHVQTGNRRHWLRRPLGHREIKSLPRRHFKAVCLAFETKSASCAVLLATTTGSHYSHGWR